MYTQKKIELDFLIWLKSYFNKINVTIFPNVRAKVSDFVMIADLIAIQPQSNVIHAFEIKPVLNSESVTSAIWQTYSYYSNYKWLVVHKPVEEFMASDKIKAQIGKLGIGVIVFDNTSNDFKILKEANFVDGDFVKYWPDLEGGWVSKQELK
jgi:hypothetical protein